MRHLISDDELWEEFAQRALIRVAAEGADFGEVLTTVEAVGSGGSHEWHEEWTATAERLALVAGSCAARGRRVSARQAWLRACTYLQVGCFPLFGPNGDPRVSASFARQTETFESAAALLPFPVLSLEIPLGDARMQAYLCLPDDSGRPRPTVVYTNGYDATVHEMYFAHVPAAIARGYNILIFDGPGQGRMLVRDGITMRPDWEVVVSAVLNALLPRPEVDDERVVLGGWSFGGFLAPRAACFEHRIAALIADPGQWDQRSNLAMAMPAEKVAQFPDGVARSDLADLEAQLRTPSAPAGMRWRLLQRGFYVNGVNSLYDYLVDMTRYEISPYAVEISCPTLLTAAEGDPIARGAPALHAAIGPGRATLLRFTAAEGAGGHCEAFARSLYHQRVYDWLDKTLSI
jgi:dienelactone hydrolase